MSTPQPTTAPGIDPQALQQALQQLHDIATPAPPGWWPLAPGWWLLLAAAVLAVVAVWLFARWRRKTALRRAALQHWQDLESFNGGDQAFLIAAAQTLRRASRSRYPASAGLTGQAWAEHLNQTGRTNFFTTSAGQQLLQARFAKQVDIDRERYKQAVQQWLQVAL